MFLLNSKIVRKLSTKKQLELAAMLIDAALNGSFNNKGGDSGPQDQGQEANPTFTMDIDLYEVNAAECNTGHSIDGNVIVPTQQLFLHKNEGAYQGLVEKDKAEVEDGDTIRITVLYKGVHIYSQTYTLQNGFAFTPEIFSVIKTFVSKSGNNFNPQMQNMVSSLNGCTSVVFDNYNGWEAAFYGKLIFCISY